MSDQTHSKRKQGERDKQLQRQEFSTKKHKAGGLKDNEEIQQLSLLALLCDYVVLVQLTLCPHHLYPAKPSSGNPRQRNIMSSLPFNGEAHLQQLAQPPAYTPASVAGQRFGQV